MIYADSTDFPNALTTDEMSFIAVDSIDPTATFDFGTDSQAEWGLLAKIASNGVVTFYCKYLTEAPTTPITIHVRSHLPRVLLRYQNVRGLIEASLGRGAGDSHLRGRGGIVLCP